MVIRKKPTILHSNFLFIKTNVFNMAIIEFIIILHKIWTFSATVLEVLLEKIEREKCRM